MNGDSQGQAQPGQGKNSLVRAEVRGRGEGQSYTYGQHWERVKWTNLKNVGPTFFKFISVSMLGSHLCLFCGHKKTVFLLL